ncbi:cysteine hydrolase family protein [Clostridium sp. MT-14]|uniref:cysteine hydrolase family protein n=1 Tax=unclassified Clostridium TaxID=2614128 RepID=UPI00123A8F06|nr:cysteine hydrolase family protein [Clostridium sp. HV4-5-A1G]KAA8680158.1 cysteine hydrolase [Clostridium sp. HV4-5-A1G]
MNLGLVLIDIQNDYFPRGKFELSQAYQAGINASKVLAFFRKNELPVFHVQHISSEKDAAFFLPDTKGMEIHKSVFPSDGELRIMKHTPDSFFQTNLKKELDSQKVDHLVICGMMMHMCVDTTVRSARNFGYSVTLIENACATKDLIWNNTIIPASTVQATFMAALDNSFANIMDADGWIKQAH